MLLTVTVTVTVTVKVIIVTAMGAMGTMEVQQRRQEVVEEGEGVVLS